MKFPRTKKSHYRALKKVEFENFLQPWWSFLEAKRAILERRRKWNLIFFNHGKKRLHAFQMYNSGIIFLSLLTNFLTKLNNQEGHQSNVFSVPPWKKRTRMPLVGAQLSDSISDFHCRCSEKISWHKSVIWKNSWRSNKNWAAHIRRNQNMNSTLAKINGK